MLTHADTFLLGASGFVAFEAWVAYKLPGPEERHRHAWFWGTRVILCGVGGLLAAVFDPQIPLQAIAIGFSTPVLPSLMTRVLKVMIAELGHTDTHCSSPNVNVTKVLDPPPDSAGLENSTIPPASDEQSSEKHEDQPVNQY